MHANCQDHTHTKAENLLELKSHSDPEDTWEMIALWAYWEGRERGNIFGHLCYAIWTSSRHSIFINLKSAVYGHSLTNSDLCQASSKEERHLRAISDISIGSSWQIQVLHSNNPCSPSLDIRNTGWSRVRWLPIQVYIVFLLWRQIVISDWQGLSRVFSDWSPSTWGLEMPGTAPNKHVL